VGLKMMMLVLMIVINGESRYCGNNLVNCSQQQNCKNS
jgi:hypothetical protein